MICVECKGNPTGYAQLQEAAWGRYPIAVSEYECERCKRVLRWWWFSWENWRPKK